MTVLRQRAVLHTRSSGLLPWKENFLARSWLILLMLEQAATLPAWTEA